MKALALTKHLVAQLKQITIHTCSFLYYAKMKVPILIPNIFNHPFTYDSDLKLKVGDYVVVPFGKSELTGVVWDLSLIHI